VTNFFVHMSHFEGVDFLIFGGEEHGSNTQEMDVFWFLRFFDFGKIAIHVVNSEEQGLVLAFVAAEDLDHPVDHFGTKGRRDGMSVKEIFGGQLVISLNHAFGNVFAIVIGDKSGLEILSVSELVKFLTFFRISRFQGYEFGFLLRLQIFVVSLDELALFGFEILRLVMSFFFKNQGSISELTPFIHLLQVLSLLSFVLKLYQLRSSSLVVPGGL